jgi:hypothetical protein
MEYGPMKLFQDFVFVSVATRFKVTRKINLTILHLYQPGKPYK